MGQEHGIHVTKRVAAGIAKMKVRINGQETDVSAVQSVGAYLASCGLDGQAVVVEHNGAVLPREGWASALLAEGDSLEVVSFVGGG